MICVKTVMTKVEEECQELELQEFGVLKESIQGMMHTGIDLGLQGTYNCLFIKYHSN